jgi:hypothetical protein
LATIFEVNKMDKRSLAILAIMITCVSFLALGCTGASQSGTSPTTGTPQPSVNANYNDTYRHSYNGTHPGYNGTMMQGYNGSYNGTRYGYNGTMMQGYNGSYNGTYMRGHNGTRPDYNGTMMPGYDGTMIPVNDTMMNPNMPYNGNPDSSGQS